MLIKKDSKVFYLGGVIFLLTISLFTKTKEMSNEVSIYNTSRSVNTNTGNSVKDFIASYTSIGVHEDCIEGEEDGFFSVGCNGFF